MDVRFWKSAGLHLVTRNSDGWLTPTADLIRAYLMRPEVHPIDESCSNEISLFEDLMRDPFIAVPKDRLSKLDDPDAADNYGIVLAYRDALVKAGTLEGAYLDIMRSGTINVPPVFIDQLVHIILANILNDCQDPIRLRAAELFFREQSVSTEDGRVMLADHEIVELQARSRDGGGLGQLLAETGTAMREIELDVLDEENSAIYWQRSDRFDTVIDLRHAQPSNNALARVIEAWIRHFMTLDVNVQPARSIKDEAWRWHIGLDRDATEILNGLYNGDDIEDATLQRILALYRMEIRDRDRVISDIAGKPVYLGLAMSPDKNLRLKPQNLLTNLPLAMDS